MNCDLNASSGGRLAAALALVLLAGGCGAAPTPGADPVTAPVDAGTSASDTDDGANEPALQTAIPGLREPRAGLYTAGQPEPGVWKAAARRGITTVIDLRPKGELAGRDEAAEVAAAGLAYHRLPVAGAGDVNDANAGRLQRLIEQAPGPVIVHCASGNRVGALLALGAAREGGMTPEQAIAFGRDAGLGSLEARVRDVLGVTTAPVESPDAAPAAR